MGLERLAWLANWGWSVSGAAKVLLGALALIAVVLPFLLPNPVATGVGLVLWGAAAFAIVPPVQTLVMQRAAEAPGLASSMNIGAFNMGNALGAAVGAGVIALGWGYAWIPVAGGVLALGGLALLLIGRWGAKAPETV